MAVDDNDDLSSRPLERATSMRSSETLDHAQLPPIDKSAKLPRARSDRRVYVADSPLVPPVQQQAPTERVEDNSVEVAPQCPLPSRRDHLDDRLQSLETKLSASLDMIENLTRLVRDLQQSKSPETLTVPATTIDPNTVVSPRKISTRPRRQSAELFAAMTRTVRTKEIATAKSLSSGVLSFSHITSRVLATFGRWSRAARAKARYGPTGGAPRNEDWPPHPLTLRHDSGQRIVWDAFILVMVTIDIVLTPLSLSFGCLAHVLDVFNMVESVAFALDFAFHALSSYTTRRGLVVTGPTNTIPHYLVSFGAVVDFLAWFPFEYLVTSGRFFGIAKVMRLGKISSLVRRFNSARKAGMFRLVGLISTVLLVSHCLTCWWNAVATEWRRQEPGYLDKPAFEQYIHSWSIVIGSLNASPPTMHTPAEEVCVAVFMLIGNVLQATVFGSVAALIQSFDEEEAAYNRKLINTHERCRFLDIPEALATRISSYYEHLYRETRSVDPDADAFINELSPALISEVKFQLYRDMVRQIPFFSSPSISSMLIETLILRLRTVIYMQDDMLIRKGEFGDWMGFIGSKGSVGVLDPNSSTFKIARVLRKGDYFGEMGLLQRTKRTTTAVALSWVQVHVLSRGDLDELSDQYPDEVAMLEHEIRKYMNSRVYWIREGKK